MRAAVALIVILSTTACNRVGNNTFRETPRPRLVSPPQLTVEPSVPIEGVPWARAGAEISVQLDIEASEGFDELTSSVSLSGIALQRGDGSTWARTLDGTEGDGRKTLDVVLVDQLGQRTRLYFDGEDTDGGDTDASDPIQVEFDFSGPRADCVISPRTANGEQDVSLSVFANEPLADWPQLAFSDDRVTPVPDVGGPGEREFSWELTFPPDVNVAQYTVVATATDRVGNGQAGDELGTTLCSSSPPADRLGLGLTASDIELAVTDGPVDGATVGTGARIEVTFTTDGPLDTNTSTVQVGDIALTWDPVDQVWFDVIDALDADGPKPLAMTLFDTAGNRTVVREPDLSVTVDQTPPSATCTITPSPANGEAPIVFSVVPTEPLTDAADPTFSVLSGAVSVDPPVQDGSRWKAAVTHGGDANLTYELGVQLTDRVGNTSTDAEVCAAADRTGEVLGEDPTVTALPTISVSGDRTHHDDDADRWIVADGTVLTVTIATEDDIDEDATTVQVGEIPLQPQGSLTWTHTVDAEADVDGLKALSVRLVDTAGNAVLLPVDDAVVLDNTAPDASCLLSPDLGNANSQVTFRLSPSEPLGAPPSITSDDVTTDDPPTDEGTRWRTGVQAPAEADTTYVLDVSATDLVGNTASGDDLCPQADRTGRIDALPPTGGSVLITAYNGVSLNGRTYMAPTGDPASRRLEVVLSGPEPLDPDLTFVALGDLIPEHVLTSPDGKTLTFEYLPDGSEGDGRKPLQGTVYDEAGNPTVLSAWSASADVWVDGTAPTLSSAVLNRDPLFAPAIEGNTLHVTTTDPITGDDVRAVLRVVATEDLGTAPNLAITGPASVEVPTPASLTERASEWVFDPLPPTQGDYGFTVVLQDLLGNVSAPLPVPWTLTVDYDAEQDPPAVDTPDTILYARAPWGATSSADSPDLRVVGEAGSVPADTLVTAENEPGLVLAQGLASADGSFELALGTDTPQVWIRSHDRAGNPSARARVRDVAWTATLGGKAVGNTFSNPHRFLVADDLSTHLPPEATEDAGFPITTERGALWSEVETSNGAEPSMTTGYAMAHHVRTGRTVLFGGTYDDQRVNDDPSGETWILQGTQWSRVSTAGNAPAARRNHAMTYDGSHDVVLLFGGLDDTGRARNDTWAFDGSTWTQLAPDTSPPARAGHKMAYDAARDVVVLHGGFGSDAGTDTWEWDGSTWTEVNPDNSPPALSAFAMTYDEAREEVVLFGGSQQGCGVIFCNDDFRDGLWTYDGTTWTQRAKSGPWPSPRARTAMTYDPVGQRVVLFGGRQDGACGLVGCDAPDLDDLWTWDGSGWTAQPTSGGPDARFGHDVAFDRSAGRLVVASGIQATFVVIVESTAAVTGTHLWNGSTWQAIEANQPPARVHAAAVHDLADQEGLMFGGLNTGSSSQTHLDDTWIWRGGRWRFSDENTRPDPRAEHAMAFVPGRGDTLLFGGTDAAGLFGDTWLWDGSRWDELNPSTEPAARRGHDMAYDAVGDRVLLFGGLDGSGTLQDETWAWRNGNWTALAPASSPAARSGAAMVHDPSNDEVLLFGGICGGGLCPAQTWVWTGANWQTRSTPTAPPPRVDAMATYDPITQVVVLQGGEDSQGRALEDTWAWDGTRWTEWTGDGDAPPPRSAGVMGSDDADVFLFGGGSNQVLGDTWRLVDTLDERPGHVFEPTLGVAQIGAGVRRRVSVRWQAGGLGDTTPGAELVVWSGLGWSVVDTHDAPVGAPAPLCAQWTADPGLDPDPECAQIADAGATQALFRTGDGQVEAFAVRPLDDAGTGDAVLRTADVAVTVRYRLPAD